MNTEKSFVKLTLMGSGNAVKINPIHIVGLLIDIVTAGTMVVTTPGITYVVQENLDQVEEAVTEVLGR